MLKEMYLKQLSDRGEALHSLDKQMLLTREFVQGFMKTLRLHDEKIHDMDENILQFRNLKELSLTGNYIENVQHLPPSIEILHLNANV